MTLAELMELMEWVEAKKLDRGAKLYADVCRGNTYDRKEVENLCIELDMQEESTVLVLVTE